ncbi:hypothetical protein F5Y07DRAFT_403270 [Xylaria sp. FL0933]|nr:hypothetical protein F5Y07DRAFT_403270 [Xylaria sp. FL0933]
MLGAHGQQRIRWEPHYINSDDAKADGHWEYIPSTSTSEFRAIEHVKVLEVQIQTYVKESGVLEAFAKRLLTWLYDFRLKLPCDVQVDLTTHRGHAAVEITVFDNPPSHLFRSQDLRQITADFVDALATENPSVAPADFAIYWLLVNRQPVNTKHLGQVNELPWTSALQLGVGRVGFQVEIEEAHEKIILPLRSGNAEPNEIYLRLRMKRRQKKNDGKNPLQAQSEQAGVPLPHVALVFRNGRQGGLFTSLAGEEQESFVFRIRREAGQIVIKRWHEEEIVAHYGQPPNFFRPPQFDLYGTLQRFPRIMPKNYLIFHPAALKLGMIKAPGNDGTCLDGVITDCYDHEYQRDPIAVPLEGDRDAIMNKEFGWQWR